MSYGIELEQLMGLPYNSPTISELRDNFETKKPVESFLPFLKVYKLDYLEDGIFMEYNSDISLYRIALFDSGHSYKSYRLKLPFDAKWGMSLEQVEDNSGMLEFSDQNIYIRKYSTEQYVIDFYFEDNKLNHIKITATLQTLKDKTKEVLQGTGLRLIPNGTVKEGNVLDGNGTMVWRDGAAIYKGDWSYGLPHGRGEYIDTFGNKYAGEFKLGFFWGQGDFYSKSLDYSYSGNYAMSMRQDSGSISYPNNTSYSGSWVQDIMSGSGTYVRGDAYIYRGEMKNNAFNGKGALQTPDGYITGEFKDGKPHGTCTQTVIDGSIMLVGHFENGLKDGKFKVSTYGIESDVVYEKNIQITTGPIDPKDLNK